jgi:anaerobic magnesium-protoporphyrin IX monomethyl ester cyclase
MPKETDIVLINPGDKKQIYQGLGENYSAVEPPFWAAVLAAYLRNNGYEIAIVDANAEDYSPEETAAKVNDLNPLLSAVIVYGSQPSASTQNMTIAGRICKAIKQKSASKIALAGLHPSALPRQTLQEETTDFVIEGEGAYTLLELIKNLKSKSGKADFSGVPGLWYREENGSIRNNPRANLIADLDSVLPVAAWDLLPMHKYKAHNWHCFDNLFGRSPYAAIYTSLGCPYSCVFCCINALFGKPGIRYRSPELVIKEIGLLAEKYGVKNIKIVDELFVLNESHYMKIVDLLIKNSYNLNLWVYARVDTVKTENLRKMKQAGINWIALGIESANPEIRDKALKNMKIENIKDIVRAIQNEGIRVIGNFIFGLPSDTMETMRETLEMAKDLNCEFVNFYCAMAYPGSKLYDMAVKENRELPKDWQDFSQHSYGALPLSTKFVSAKEVLKFRDEAFNEYFSNPVYLNMLRDKFGEKVRAHIEEMSKVRLKRMILQ